jgi:hypothetical protein
MAMDIDDLRDNDKMQWLKVVDLANMKDEDGNYVNPALHVTYAALTSGFRVFKIENNPNLGPGTAGRFTITKFNGPNDFSEARLRRLPKLTHPCFRRVTQAFCAAAISR